MQILDSYKGYDFFSRSGGVVVFKGKEYVAFFENLNEAYENVFPDSKEKKKKVALRTMYEDYLNTVMSAELIGDEFGYRGWSYIRYETKQFYDWQGKKISAKVEKIPTQIWLGKNGGIYKDKNHKIKVDNAFVSRMKRWCWKKYFNLDI